MKTPLTACLALLYLLLWPAGEAEAQFFQQKPRLGIRAGLTYAQLRRDRGDTNRRFGLAAGLFTRVPLNEGVFLQPELLFGQKGGRTEGNFAVSDTVSVPVTVRYRISYLEVPLLVHAVLPTEGTARASFFGGPYAGLTVRSRAGTDPEEINGEPLTPQENYEDLDYGVTIGMNLDVPWKERTVVLDLRYDYGLRDIDDISTAPAQGGGEVNLATQNSTFMLTLGLLF